MDNDTSNEEPVVEDIGDTTPEEGSPAPPPPASGSGSRLPQIPSYTQNSYNTSLPPPYRSTTAPPTKNPPIPPPASALSALAYQGGLNFPPPPLPVNVTSYKEELNQPQPLPTPPPAPLPALKANGPSLTNSNRRPPSKDYYNRGSPGSGGRGYYTSNSHRDRSRDYRDREFGDRRSDRDRDRGDRDRDRGDRDRDYRSQSSRRQYQSRSYY